MSVRAMLARVRRLEQARAPVRSPFAAAFGSFEAFAAECEERISAGKLDDRDFPVVLHSISQWERDGTWGAWQFNRTWQMGAAR